MDLANVLLLAIGSLSVALSLLLILFLEGTKKYVIASVGLSIIALVPMVTSWESSRRIVASFREMALNGTGGIVKIAVSLREATELAIFGHRILIGMLLLLLVVMIFQLGRRAASPGTKGSGAWLRRAFLIGGPFLILVSGAVLSELSLRSRALPLAVTIPLTNGDTHITELPLTDWAWNHLELDSREGAIGEVADHISYFFIAVSMASLVLGTLGFALLVVNVTLCLTGGNSRGDLLSLLVVTLISLLPFALGSARNQGFLEELDSAVARQTTSDQNRDEVR